ncbi:MAG: copper chaperone PCu(A)C [Alphaproteobacteria bacterium]
MPKRLLASLAALTIAGMATLALAHEYKVAEIEIGHPWARPTAPTATVGAGYFSLKNDGKTDDRLVAASSPAAEKVELHSMTMTDGVMKMRQVPSIELHAGKSVTLAPGGLHLMLIGLKAPLKEGTKVPATLTFERAGDVAVEFAIQAETDSGEKHDMPMHKH